MESSQSPDAYPERVPSKAKETAKAKAASIRGAEGWGVKGGVHALCQIHNFAKSVENVEPLPISQCTDHLCAHLEIANRVLFIGVLGRV